MPNIIATIRWWPIIMMGFLLDQLSKWLVLQHFQLGEAHPVFTGLNLRLAHNEGIAFSLLNEGGMIQWFLTAMTLIIIIVLFGWLHRITRREPGTAFALSLILGGALGNLLDRIRLGYVVDFIDCFVYDWHWPTFNLADTWICLGAFIIMLSVFKKTP